MISSTVSKDIFTSKRVLLVKINWTKCIMTMKTAQLISSNWALKSFSIDFLLREETYKDIEEA